MQEDHTPLPKPESPGSTLPVSRREFLTRAGAAGAAVFAVTAAGVALWQTRTRVPGFETAAGLALPDYGIANTGPALAIARGTARPDAIRAALDALGGMGRFVGRGDVVLLKPNAAFDRPAALGATTHPETLETVARLALEAGAAEVLVADNPINNPEACFFKSGLTEAARRAGARIVLPAAGAFQPLALPATLLDGWPVFAGALRRVNRVIGLAPCKDHNLAGASMTIKNWYGLLGGPRNQLHQRIDDAIAALAQMIRPTLVVLDGTVVLARNGPTGGRLSDLATMNTIVAGTDPVAVDACGWERLLRRDPQAAPAWLALAEEQGLGTRDWRSLSPKEV